MEYTEQQEYARDVLAWLKHYDQDHEQILEILKTALMLEIKESTEDNAKVIYTMLKSLGYDYFQIGIILNKAKDLNDSEDDE